MDLLIYVGTFLAGLAVGYFFALFEAWIDKRGESGE